MSQLVKIDASSVYADIDCHDNWIPTGRKSQISLDFFNSSLTLEYEEFLKKSFVADASIYPSKKMGAFYWENYPLKLKQVNEYRCITNYSDTTNQSEHNVEVVPCTKLVEYSQLDRERTTNPVRSRTNPDGKTIWFLRFNTSVSGGIIYIDYEFDFVDMSCIFTAYYHSDSSSE
jgi:hypothetical protein